MPLDRPIIYSALTILGLFAIWQKRTAKRIRAIDARFGISILSVSGPSKQLEDRRGGYVAFFDCEVGVGECDYAVRARDLCWSAPEVRSFSADEREQFFATLRDWAAARRYKIEVLH